MPVGDVMEPKTHNTAGTPAHDELPRSPSSTLDKTLLRTTNPRAMSAIAFTKRHIHLQMAPATRASTRDCRSSEDKEEHATKRWGRTHTERFLPAVSHS